MLWIHIHGWEPAGMFWWFLPFCWRFGLRRFICTTCQKLRGGFSTSFNGSSPAFGLWISLHPSAQPLTSMAFCIFVCKTSEGSIFGHGSSLMSSCCYLAGDFAGGKNIVSICFNLFWPIYYICNLNEVEDEPLEKKIWTWEDSNSNPRLPDFLVLFLKIYDGPAGVLRVARMHRVLRLGRFVQVLRTERFTKQRWKPPCPARIWKTLERFQSSRRDTLSFIRRDDLRTFIQPVAWRDFEDTCRFSRRTHRIGRNGSLVHWKYITSSRFK